MNTTHPAVPRLPLVGFALLALPLALAGCHKDIIVGKWQGTTTSKGQAAKMTFNFTQDGKETISMETTGGPISMTVGAGGTYTVSGSSLTQNITSATIMGMTMNLPADKAKPQTGTFTLDGDHLTLTTPTDKQALTLTRVKEAGS